MSKLRLRKCVGILTVLATLLLASPVVAVEPAVISIDDCGANYDTTVIAPINITGASGLAGATIKLHYNKDVVIVDSVTPGTMGGLTAGIDNVAGVITLVWYTTTPVDGNAVFANVTLYAVGSGGATSPLQLDVVDFGDSDGSPLAYITEDGVFTVLTVLAAEAGGPYSGETGSPVSLSGLATGGTSPYTYAWDLDNDGTYETPGKDVNYTWTESGAYVVGLEVTDVVSDTATDTADVNISDVYYRLTVTCEPEGTGSVTLTPTQPVEGYVSGTSVNLMAVGEEGYALESWSGDLSGSANPTSILMDSNKNVTANFKEIPAGTTPVTGNVVKAFYIDVTAPSAIVLGDMRQGETVTGQSTIAGSVDTNAATWSVEASDLTNGGFMRLDDGTPLTNTLQIGKSVEVYAGAAVGILYVDETSLPFYVSQTVELSDVVATGYSITITFTGLM